MPPGRRYKLRLGLLVCALALLGLEACARVASTVLHDVREEDSWYVYSDVLGWDRRPGFSGRVYGPPRTFDRDGFLSVDTTKIDSDRSKPRVVFFGDSITFGIGVDAEHTFVEILDRTLGHAHCINLAVPGYSSYQGYQAVMEYAERVAPSLIVAAFNINDRRYVLDPSEIDGPKRFGSLKAQSKVSALEKSHLFCGMQRGLRRFRKSGGAGSAGADDVSRLHPRVSPDDYRENLTRLATWTKSKAIPLLFVLFHDNPHSTANLRQGLDFWTAGDYWVAADRYKAAILMDDMFSTIAQVKLSSLYDKVGHPVDAAITRVMHKSYHSVHGGSLLSPDTDYHRIMREVADGLGVALVDTADLAYDDPSVYFDFCHFNRYGHHRVAELLAPPLKSLALE